MGNYKTINSWVLELYHAGKSLYYIANEVGIDIENVKEIIDLEENTHESNKK